jgi:hypothetical protein
MPAAAEGSEGLAAGEAGSEPEAKSAPQAKSAGSGKSRGAKPAGKAKAKSAGKAKSSEKAKPAAKSAAPAEKQPKSPAAAEPKAASAAEGEAAAPAATGFRPSRRAVRIGLVAIAVVVALIAWLATRDGGSGSSEPEAAAGGEASRVVTVDDLRETAAALGQPIYWAGPPGGKEMVLKELPEGGGVQLFYAPEGTKPDEVSPKLLTIGSYPLSDPQGNLSGYAERQGAIVRQAPGGREVVTNEKTPTSVYFASPENSVQVEVYDPSPQKAMSLAVSGTVQPAG